MTQNEPLVPGTIAATALVTAAFVVMFCSIVATLYGLHRLLSWLLG